MGCYTSTNSGHLALLVRASFVQMASSLSLTSNDVLDQVLGHTTEFDTVQIIVLQDVQLKSQGAADLELTSQCQNRTLDHSMKTSRSHFIDEGAVNDTTDTYVFLGKSAVKMETR